MRALSILFVTSRFPLPLLSGDRARAFQQLRILSARHRVTLVTFADPRRHGAALAQLESHGIRVVTVPFARLTATARVVRAAWSSLPLQAALYNAPRMRATIRAVATAERFDVLHVQLARTVPLIDPDLPVPHVVDLIDALSLNMRRRAEHDRGWARWAASIEAPRLARAEQAICATAAAAFVVAPADREAIGDWPTLHINPNGVDPAAFPRVDLPRDPGRLVFTGNLGYFPNVDAACWLVEQVLPHVWREMPAARLVLAGARPHHRLRALAARDHRIEIAGDVPHLHPWIASGRVALAPMRAGSGQLLKVLEAMSTGTPVVTTSRGVSGIDAVAGEHLLVADQPDLFAAQVLRLMRDDALARRLAASAHALVEQRYTWERSVADLERIYLEVAAGAPAAANCA